MEDCIRRSFFYRGMLGGWHQGKTTPCGQSEVSRIPYVGQAVSNIFSPLICIPQKRGI